MSENPIVAGIRELLAECEKRSADIDNNLLRAKAFQLASHIEHAKEIPVEVYSLMPIEMQQGCLQFMLGIIVQSAAN